MKFNKLKKIFILSGLLLMFLFAAACGGGTDTDGAGSDGGSIPHDPAESANGGETPGETAPGGRPASVLPDAAVDFDGREFRMVQRPVLHLFHRHGAEEMTGEPVHDAVFIRNARIESMYNVRITYLEHDNPHNLINSMVMAGDDLFEMMIKSKRDSGNLGAQGMLWDLYDVPYIGDSLRQGSPWWDHALQRDLSIFGTLHFQSGDLIMQDKLRVAVMYFNKDMFTGLGIPFPYHHVYAGTWTIDTMLELTRGINRDLDGTGMTQKDQWGMMSEYFLGLHLFSSAGMRSVTLDSDGVPQITKNTPRAVDVIRRVLEVSIEPGNVFHANRITGAGPGGVWVQASNYFQENRFAIRTSVLEPVVRDLRAMPTDFGLLPFVKFDEYQENYYTHVNWDGWVVSIPSVADPEFAGFIIEALAYESGDTVMPAFIDLALYSQILRDDESEGMLHIIWDNRIYDIGTIFGIGRLDWMLHDMVRDNSTDFVSRFEAARGTIESSLNTFINTYLN